MHEGLATQLNRKRRTLTKDRCYVRDMWVQGRVGLPCRDSMYKADCTMVCPDWLLLLLASVDAATKSKILLLLYRRSWHLRNDIIHDLGKASVEGSVAFLLSYAESLDLISHQVAFDDNGKGKGKIGLANPALDGNSNRTVKAAQWNPPPHGWIKVNSDAGFCKDTGTAGCGVVARNEDGEVILTAWHCGSPEQAEACLDAVRLASEWIRQPICLESDCSVIVNAIKMNDSSRACWAGTTAETVAVSRLLPDCKVSHTRRSRRQPCSGECAVLRFDMPPEARALVQADAARISRSKTPCNSSIS
jgi:ribonuclease HI